VRIHRSTAAGRMVDDGFNRQRIGNIAARGHHYAVARKSISGNGTSGGQEQCREAGARANRQTAVGLRRAKQNIAGIAEGALVDGAVRAEGDGINVSLAGEGGQVGVGPLHNQSRRRAGNVNRVQIHIRHVGRAGERRCLAGGDAQGPTSQ